MNTVLKPLLSAASITALAVLGACDGSGSTGSGNPSGGSAMVANDFAFPELGEANGEVSVNATATPPPSFSARRTISAGSGSVIEFGDPVVLRYTMHSWTTGELVESSDDRSDPLTVRAGMSAGVPEFLTKSLPGRNLGDTIQVVFEKGMHDLPEYLDRDDAYVVVVELM